MRLYLISWLYILLDIKLWYTTLMSKKVEEFQ